MSQPAKKGREPSWVLLVSIQDQVKADLEASLGGFIPQMTVGGVRPWAAGVRNPLLGPEKGRSQGEEVVVIQGS